MKKWTSLFLALVMMLSCVSIPAFAEEKPTLTIWIREDLRIEDWETNAETKWLEDQLGINLDFVAHPSSDYTTKVNMALTVGAIEDLPDIITGVDFSDASVWEWAQAESIIPLTEYINNPELAVNINKSIESTGVDYPKQIQSPDGNIYALPTFNQSYGNEYPAKTFIYKPWLDAIGMEVPTTTEEFYQVLKKIKETDLNGNGIADEIPMAGATTGLNKEYIDFLMNPFAYMGDSQYRHVQDGVVTASYTTDGWKEGLKYIKKLFDEGLVLAESLTMVDEQFKTLAGNQECPVFAQTAMACAVAGDNKYDYIYINPLKGPEGLQYATFVPSVAHARFMITANCKDPELAFKVGDLLQSEYIGISERWGAEGLDWDYPENAKNVENYEPSYSNYEKMSMIPYDDNNFWGGTAVTNGSWRQKGPYVRQYSIANARGVLKGNADKYAVLVNESGTAYQTGGYQPAEVIPKLIYTSDETDLIAEIEVNLKNYVDESLAAFVTGNKDIDAEWDSYLAELDKIGLKTYLEVVQTVYDRMYK